MAQSEDNRKDDSSFPSRPLASGLAPEPLQRIGNCLSCGGQVFAGYGHVCPRSITLRDQLAMAALTGYLSGTFIDQAVNDGEYTGDPNVELTARDCYRYADAMMEARKSPASPSGDKVGKDGE